jgi:hypothetical protein
MSEVGIDFVARADPDTVPDTMTDKVESGSFNCFFIPLDHRQPATHKHVRGKRMECGGGNSVFIGLMNDGSITVLRKLRDKL